VNGNLDISTPPAALKEINGFAHNAQLVLLSDTSHTGDLVNLQPDPFEHLAATCFADSESGASLFVHQVERFERGNRPPLPAKALVAVIIIIPLLIIGLVIMISRKISRRKANAGRVCTGTSSCMGRLMAIGNPMAKNHAFGWVKGSAKGKLSSRQMLSSYINAIAGG